MFDYITILLLVSLFAILGVIMLIKVIYGHNPNAHEQYGEEIILFHSDESYKKRIFRFHLIEDLKNIKNTLKADNELEIKLIVGEFSEGTQEIVRHAINHDFRSIMIITGPKVFCEDRSEIYTLLDKYENVKYFVLPERPNRHFIIFNKSHLYIEKPHRHNESRGSVGIKKSNLKLLEIYNNAFNKMLEYARPLNKEEVLSQECYND